MNTYKRRPSKVGVWVADFPTYQEYDREYKKKHRELYKEKYCAYMRSYNEKNREKLNIMRVTRVYGISPEEYTVLLEEQKGLCAICSEKETASFRPKGRIKNLSVDHCHKTGKVRGLLCQRCNQALGLLRHNKEFFLKAIQYLNV